MPAPDRPHLRELYKKHVDFVWRSLARLGVRERDLPDVTQEVFIVALRKLSEFEGRSRETTWLFGIAMRTASDYRRSARVRHEVLAETESTVAADGDDAHVQAVRNEERERLYAILEAMPEEQRIVFSAFELGELTALEISSLVGAPLGTVKSRLRLGRQSFRASLAARLALDLEPEGKDR